jgi:hypothetical protein
MDAFENELPGGLEGTVQEESRKTVAVLESPAVLQGDGAPALETQLPAGAVEAVDGALGIGNVDARRNAADVDGAR